MDGSSLNLKQNPGKTEIIVMGLSFSQNFNNGHTYIITWTRKYVLECIQCSGKELRL